jgi:16S rRNA (adenine1518-N6/adenine1519-N6)-dimethyltransferase
MQTRRQIQQLLSSAGASPNRKLGQHFLVDLNLMRLLIDSAQPGPEDVVLEVGCGTGSLTEALAERGAGVVAVEIDRTLAAVAASQLTGRDHVDIINADVLSNKGTIDPVVVEAVDRVRRERSGRLLLVCNLPYDVASAVMINLVRGSTAVDAMAVTVQKEVADRMAAAPGGKHYGTLSIFLQATGRVEVLRVLKPGVFWPPPKVDSAMVRFVASDEQRRRIKDMTVLREVVGLFMQHRRKMLRACVRYVPPGLGDRNVWLQIFERCSIDATQRPARLSPGQYVALANACCDLLADRRAGA